MRRARRHEHQRARSDGLLGAVGGERRLALLDDEQLRVRMPVQARAAARRGVDEDQADADIAVLGAHELGVRCG